MAHLLIVLFILLGNIGYFVSRRSGRAETPEPAGGRA